MNAERWNNLKELLLVTAAITAIHIALALRGLPLPHGDCGAYVEPALLLASDGKLAGPATQHQDLLYRYGFYSYPPGFFVLLSGWIRLFGPGATSLLLYTHVVHSLLMVLLWALLRFRLRVSRLATALAVLSLFPVFNHGRPDVTALLLGVTAWLLLPWKRGLVRLLAAAFLLGCAVSVSPAYGISSAVAVGTYQFCAPDQSLRERFLRTGCLASLAITTLSIILFGIIWWQSAWELAWTMWKNHVAIRGRELNTMPALASAYEIRFTLLPFVLLTLAPLAAALVYSLRRPSQRATLLVPSICFLAGAVVWLLSNKAVFLLGGHFAYLARPVFQGCLASAYSTWLRRLGLLTLAAFLLVHCYYHRAMFVLLCTGEDLHVPEDVCEFHLEADQVLAVDSQYFTSVYRPGKTITYEVYASLNRWERYRDMSPGVTRMFVGDLVSAQPLDPDIVILSRMSLNEYGPPNKSRYELVSGDDNIVPVRILGMKTGVIANPLGAVVYYRIAPMPDAVRESVSCR
ncbi:MAG TPA: hypothetical protein VG013_14415 [Gemmataceae bacterium]|nr:hypothetical protein [Gemmataceae bacterium]